MDAQEIEELLNMDIKLLELELAELYDPGQDADVTITAWSRQDIGDKIKHIRRKLEESINASRASIHQKVCVEMKFCETVKNDKVNMVMWIVDSGVIISTGGIIPLPPVRATVYAVRLGLFDRLCGC